MSLLAKPKIETGEMYVNFNQNVTSLAVATKTGYILYSLGSIDSTLDKIYSYPSEEIYLIERLFESSLVAIVLHRAPRKLKVCHFKKQSEICNYAYSNTILAIKLNRERLVVCLEESLYIHNIQDMKVVHTIRDTPSNPKGLCALSTASEHCYLAYPGSTTSGEVQVFDAINLHARTMIPAHDTTLAAIAFSPAGSEIATASERGTVIRVFSSLDGTKLFELRRGLKRCVAIGSLTFSTCGAFLVSSSNTETVHIFHLDRSATEQTETKPTNDHWMGFLSKTVSSYLPSQVTDVFSQGRAFASVTLPEGGIRRKCAITTIQKQLRLLIASQDGCLYVYSIPSVEGGECQLIKKHDLRSDENHAMDIKVDSSQPLGTPTSTTTTITLEAAAATITSTITTPTLTTTTATTTTTTTGDEPIEVSAVEEETASVASSSEEPNQPPVTPPRASFASTVKGDDSS